MQGVVWFLFFSLKNKQTNQPTNKQTQNTTKALAQLQTPLMVIDAIIKP